MSGSRRRQALLAGLAAAGLAVAPVALASAPQSDPAGDTRNADKQPVDAPAADIVSIQAEPTETDVVFRYTVSKPADPLTDPGWPSEDSYSDFWVDTDGDGEPNYDVEYGVDEGELYVIVVSTGDEDTPLCEGKASYVDSQYVAAVPKECLGNPASFSYRVDTSYAASPDPSSPAAYDTAPDSGMAAG